MRDAQGRERLAQHLCAAAGSNAGLALPPGEEATLTPRQLRITGDAPAYEVEYRFRHKDGSYRWILDRGVAVRNAQGVTRMAGSHTDITERKQMEQELRESEQRHQAALAELAAELARLRAQLGTLPGSHQEPSSGSGSAPDGG